MENDLEYWSELYLTHSKTQAFKRRVEKSRETIKEFIELRIKSYVAISGGKDSTAMMHLVHSICPNMPFVSEKDDMDFPNELEYMHLLKDKYNLDLTILTPNVKLWDILLNHDFTEDIHSKGTDFSDQYFYGLLKEYQAQNQYKGVFLGLRAKESKGRLHNLMSKGYIYYNAGWKQAICQPLADWTAQDIFAYLFAYDVPILDVYFKTKFVNSPEDIRKSWILPSAQTSQGQAVWLKYYYPEIYMKLCIINPKLRSYV